MKKLLIEAGLWEEGFQLVALGNEGEIRDIFSAGHYDCNGDRQKAVARVEEKK